MARTRLTADDVSGTLAELVANLGSVPLHRIRRTPAPGTATVADITRVLRRTGRLCELIDRTLVEKAWSLWNSALATALLCDLGTRVDELDLGVILGGGGMMQLREGLIRGPAVSFIPWHRWPEERPDDPEYLPVYPDLAVEIINRGNTRDEIARKIREFFFAGTKLFWVIHPRKQLADVYTAPDERTRLTIDGTLDGGAVVPGFRLPLADLFARTRPRKKDDPT